MERHYTVTPNGNENKAANATLWCDGPHKYNAELKETRHTLYDFSELKLKKRVNKCMN